LPEPISRCVTEHPVQISGCIVVHSPDVPAPKDKPTPIAKCIADHPITISGCVSKDMPVTDKCSSVVDWPGRELPKITVGDTQPLSEGEKLDLAKQAQEIVKTVELTHGFGHTDSGDTQRVIAIFEAAQARGNEAVSYLLNQINDSLKDAGYPARVRPQGSSMIVEELNTGKQLDHVMLAPHSYYIPTTPDYRQWIPRSPENRRWEKEFFPSTDDAKHSGMILY
jgi:hypothetical protein